MRHLALSSLLVLLLAASGCALVQPVNPAIPVTPETTTQCVDHCRSLGLRLAAVVLVHNSAGCVCEVSDRTASNVLGSAAVAATVAILDDEAAAAQQQAGSHHMGPGPGTPGSGAPGFGSPGAGMPGHH